MMYTIMQLKQNYIIRQLYYNVTVTYAYPAIEIQYIDLCERNLNKT